MCACYARINDQAHGQTVAACDVAAHPGAAWIQSELAAWLQAMRPHTLAESLTLPTLSGTCPAFLVRLPPAVGSRGAAALPALGCAVHEIGQLCGAAKAFDSSDLKGVLFRSPLPPCTPLVSAYHRGGCMAVPKMLTAPHQGLSRSA